MRGRGQGEGGAGSAPDGSNVSRRQGAIHTFERAERAARRLRREPTPAEARLWKALKGLEVAGSHFRRQVPLGPYVADFACYGARLIVEVDGGMHRLTGERDRARDAWLAAEGWRALRLTNDEAWDLDRALARIEDHL